MDQYGSNKGYQNWGWGDNKTVLCKDLNLECSQKFISVGISNEINNFENIADLYIGKMAVIISLLISKITLCPVVYPLTRTPLKN